MDRQTAGFIEGEADAWFRRNRDHLRADSPLRELFLANPAYRLAAKLSASHDALAFSADPQERIGIWLCRKDVANAYATIGTP